MVWEGRVDIIPMFRERDRVDHRDYIFLPLFRNTVAGKNSSGVAAVLTCLEVFPIVNVMQKRSVHYISVGDAFVLQGLCEQCSLCQSCYFEGVGEAMGIIDTILFADAVDGLDHGLEDGFVDEFDLIHQ